MRSPPTTLAALVVSLLLGLGGQPDQDQPAPPQVRPAPQPSCSVCHPGSLESLRRSVHASFLNGAAEAADQSCLRCHVQGLTHQTNPRSAAHPPGKGIESCATCHAGMTAPAAERALRLSHPRKDEAPRTLAEAQREKAPVLTSDFQDAAAAAGLAFEGMVRGGWRFVDVNGDERAFDHDWGLDPGPRLTDLELRARRDGSTLLDGSMHGLDDREFSTSLATGRGLSESWSADASFRRNRYVYDAEGDYHTLSNRRDWTQAGLQLAPDGARGASLFRFEYERLDLDGTTLGSRIGNPNASPLVPATGVPVERNLTSEDFRVVTEHKQGEWAWSVEVGYEGMRMRDDLTYARPSPSNPGFTESEISSGRSSQHGFHGQARMVFGRQEELQIELFAAGSYYDLRYVEDSVLQAFDTSSFTTGLHGDGNGNMRTMAFLARASQGIWSHGRVLLEAELNETRQDVGMDYFETTVRTSPPLVTQSAARYDLLTRVRERGARFGVEQALGDSLDAELGWRWVTQNLDLPDLEPLDADYRAGDVRAHGPDVALTWRLDELHRAQVSWTFAATDSRTPTETQPEIGQRLLGKLRRKLGSGMSQGYVEVWGKWRRAENDVSSTERDGQHYGLSLGGAPWQEARFEGRLGWARLRSRTLTNFYYGSIVPVPTYVGFEGDSWLADLTLESPIAGPLWGLVVFGLQATQGSLDSTLLRLDTEVSWRISELLKTGVSLSFFDFSEDTGGPDDDYDARVAMVFAELRF